MNKDELKNFIIYLDLSYMSHQPEGLSTNGIMTYLNLQKQYPKFDNESYRRKLSKKIFKLIDEVKENEH